MFNEKCDALALSISSKYNVNITGLQVKLFIILICVSVVFIVVLIVNSQSTIKKADVVPDEVRNMTVSEQGVPQ